MKYLYGLLQKVPADVRKVVYAASVAVTVALLAFGYITADQLSEGVNNLLKVIQAFTALLALANVTTGTDSEDEPFGPEVTE